MKYFKLMAAAMIGSATLTSCFKDEPLNAECDIEQAYIHLDDPTSMFFQASDTLINVLPKENTVNFKVRLGSDCTALTPYFKLTEGATISPENGSTHDFSDGKEVIYTVTSQDNHWSRPYKVRVIEDERTIGDTITYSFEHYKFNEASDFSDANQYYEWFEINSKEQEIKDWWASGNQGFAISVPSARPDEYPTAPTEGYEGKGVILTTRSTGELGAAVGKRIAAGNIFIGTFDGMSALMDAMKATQFGKPFDRKPIKFEGYYKFTPGKDFQDENGNIVQGKEDICNIYAVIYKNHDEHGNPVVLYGDDVKTSKQLVGIAEVKDIKTTDTWTKFETVFDYTEDIDLQLLENRGYNMAIVCSSSEEGASFKGAVGSTLCVDELQIICAKIEE